MVDLVKRDPFRNIFTWPHWLEEWGDEFPTLTTSRGLRIHKDDKNIYVDAVVAGVPADDVQVDIEDGVVTIKAEKKTEENLPAGRQGKKGEYKAFSYNYYYTCTISGGQWDKAKAEVADGVLELSIPKTEVARPRKITVKAKGK